jgi:hypothetical protein
MTTGSIAGEREARTWEVLLTTPLKGWAIVLGKLAGSFRAQWFLPLAVLAHFVLAAALGYVSPYLPLHLCIIYLGPILLFTATGQFYSLVFRKGVTAAACNLFTALMLWGGLWVLLGVLAWSTEAQDSRWFDRAADALVAVNPVAMVVDAYEPAVRGGVRWSSHAQIYQFGVQRSHWSAGGFTLILLAALAFYTAAAAAVTGAGMAAFRRLSGRSS